MRWLKLILELLFWCIAAGAVMLGAVVIVGFAFRPVLGYVAGIAVIGFLPLFLRMARVIRSRRAATVLTYLDQAVRLNLPLPRMLAAATASERGVLALRLGHVRTLLEEGAPLGAALEAAVPEMPRREISIIAASERIARLPQGIARCLRQREQELHKASMHDQVVYRAYPVVMIVMLSGVIALVAIFVLPKFEQIFKDFNVALPPVTLAVFSTARGIGPFVALAVVIGVLLASAMTLWQAVRPVRASRGWLPRGVRDTLAWWTPMLHRIERDRGLTDAFDLLAEAFAIGMPADRALAEATGLGVNTMLRRRLHRWAEAVSAGASLGDGARAAAMPPLVVGMLSNVSATAAAAEVFAFLARYYRTRFSRAAALLEAAAAPLVVFFFGVLVALVALAMFTPLITLIQSVAVHAPRGL